MRTHLPFSVLALGAILAPLASQEPAQEPAPAITESVPALELRTTDQDLVMQIVGAFGGTPAEPTDVELPEGQVYLVTVNAAREVDVQTVQGSGWLDAEARPGALMEMFAPQVAQYRGMATMMAGMATAQQGIAPEALNEIIAAVFDFPTQIDRIRVTMPNEPEGGAASVPEMALVIDPRMDTWFGKLVADLRPNPAGVQVLPNADAAVNVAMNVDLAQIADDIGPLVKTLSGMTAQDPEAREEAVAVTRDLLESMSGSGQLLVDQDGMTTWIGGLVDPGKANELLHSDRYAEYVASSADRMGVADVTLDMNAATHRDVKVVSQTVELDMGGMGAMGGETVQTTLTAVAADCLIMKQADSAASITGTIDAVLDHELQKKQLGDGVLLTAEISGSTVPLTGMFDEPGEEETGPPTNVTVSKKGTSLRIDVKTASQQSEPKETK